MTTATSEDTAQTSKAGSQAAYEAAQSAITSHTEQVNGLAAQIAALDRRQGQAQARLQAAEQGVAQAQSAQLRAQEAHRTAQALQLIATAAPASPGAGDGSGDGSADALAATQATIAEAQTRVEGARQQRDQVATQVKGEISQIAVERAQLEQQQREALALHSELQQHKQAAHEALGRQALRELGAEYVRIASQLGEGYRQVEAARKALDQLEQDAPQRLAEWPALRAQMARYVSTGALRSFDILASMCTWLQACYAGAGRAASVPTKVDGKRALLQMHNLLGGSRGLELLAAPFSRSLIPSANVDARPYVRQLELRRQQLQAHLVDAAVATRPEILAGDSEDAGAKE